MVNDPISDFLSQIKNAVARKKESISVDYSGIVHRVSEIMLEEGFIDSVSIVDKSEESKFSKIMVNLKYVNGDSAITNLKRVSKPGIRRYRGYKDIDRVRNGLGISVYSTPLGVMTGENARKNKVGGEYICDVF